MKILDFFRKSKIETPIATDGTQGTLKVKITVDNYSDFKVSMPKLGVPQIVFYLASSGIVGSIFCLMTDGQVVTTNGMAEGLTEATFLTDFPAAVQIVVDINFSK